MSEQVPRYTAGGLTITDHALLRYLERCKGVDLEQIKTEMLPTRTADAISKLGDGTYTIHDRFTAVVRSGCVVTVYRKGE